MSADLINIRVWDDIHMCYSKPTTYINDILLQFEMEKLSDTRSTKERVEELIPFLAGKEVTHLKPPTAESNKKSNHSEFKEISDKEFERLMTEL